MCPRTCSITFAKIMMASDAFFGIFSSSSLSGLMVVSSACRTSAAASLRDGSPRGAVKLRIVEGNLKDCMMAQSQEGQCTDATGLSPDAAGDSVQL